jgi:UDPglucose--hexose-1-phosphate uridylyltransferase
MSATPEVRIDQLNGLRTILAAGRAERPVEFAPAPRSEGAEQSCPFCEGREDRTPPELWADRPGGGAPDTPGWRVRAVPNLYPAVGGGRGATGSGAANAAAEAPRDPLRASARGGEPDLFSSSPASGAHEVIVSSPRHRLALGELEEAELGAAVAGWRERMRAHADSSCVALIVNEGGGAGASLEHSHAQLYALDFVPVSIARERERFSAYGERTMGGELLADIAADEVRRRERLVGVDEEALIVCPWASRSPYELRVIPRRAQPHFEQDDEVGTAALATALRALRNRFGEGLELNLWVRSAPRGAEPFHWHIDIAPRLAIKAGFELASGVDINTFAPERAAAELREALG